MWQDLRYGLRSILNQRSFTALAVLTLALGIGAATTITGAFLRLVVVGVVLGLLGSIAAMKVLASQLFGVSPRDPTTLIAVVAAMTMAAAAASYFPARRAMNVNPIVALRGD